MRSSNWTRTSRPLPTAARASFAKSSSRPASRRRRKSASLSRPPRRLNCEMGETMMTLFPDDGFKITCTSADKQRPVHAILQHGNHAQDLGKGTGPRADVLFLRGNRVSHQKRPHQGRQPGKCRRHPRRRGAHDRAAAVSRGIRAAQDARHRRRSVAARPADSRAFDRRQTEPRGELRNGPANRRADEQAVARAQTFGPPPAPAPKVGDEKKMR